ncbi:mucolipin-3 isoform X2 [Poecilia formosa]|uniref:mucolipin-3 isoform X2 n=1 Tax=Poecilia formosa TaxID=48698 RepID=UPI0007B9DDAF|nr:PREDICTED: mucolipin-3-like isoform X2 [Poecilia formosa]
MEESEQLLTQRSEGKKPNGHCRWSTHSLDSKAVEDFRRRLKYFFMNPCEKYRAKGRKPWKLMLQIWKIVIITAQLVLFGLSNEMMATFKEDNLMTFEHLFLKGFKDHWQGNYALYTKADLYDHIYHVIDTYTNLQNLTLENLAYGKIDGKYTPLSVCQLLYKNSTVDPERDSFYIDPHIDEECISVFPPTSLDNTNLERNINFSVDLKRLVSVNINFTLKTINLQTVRHHELPDCYGFHIKEFKIFFQTHFNKLVTWSERMEFVNGWYILINISDTLTITGSVIKIGIQTKFLTNYDVCSILLGTATMLVWIGVIRYLGYFKKYNILILTLRAAFPNVIRFCCCAAMIYLGYCFCGWIVLGPYHDKFRTFDKVTECLFSLINGDDMFATFLNMRDKSYMVWLFSRIYLYTFTSLFIYMVLSLFIALITDTYETIKHHQKDSEPASLLHAFIEEVPESA